MTSKNKLMMFLVMLCLISISSISIVSAAMNIEGGAFSTEGGLDDLTYASIDVGKAYSGENIIVQIFYTRDGSDLNNGNMVPKTVTSNGFVNVKSADPYKYFPDHAEINIFDADSNLLDTQEVDLSPSKGIQTFGSGDYDHGYIKSSSSNSQSSSDSESHSNSESRGSSHDIDVTTSETFHFYATNSPAANDDYYAAVVVDGNPYYLGNSEYDELCEYSNSFASGMITQFQDTSTNVGDFDLRVDKPFSFHYKIGKVGLNKEAHIITNLNLDD